jgi:hypothetical protein
MRIRVAGDGVLAILLAGGDDQPGGDVAQAQLLAAEVQGDASMASSVTAAPPIALPRARADSWPSRESGTNRAARSGRESGSGTQHDVPGRPDSTEGPMPADDEGTH